MHVFRDTHGDLKYLPPAFSHASFEIPRCHGPRFIQVIGMSGLFGSYCLEGNRAIVLEAFGFAKSKKYELSYIMTKEL